jgi:hypothetical protein
MKNLQTYKQSLIQLFENKIFKIYLSVFLIILSQNAFAQRGLELAQNFVDNFGNRNKVVPAKMQKPENISDQISMVSEALKYRIDSIIESNKFDVNLPFSPVRAHAFSFDGWGNDMRVTEERIYEYNPGANDFSGQRTRRSMTYNGNRQLTLERLEEFNNGTWSELDRVEITYNSRGHLATVKEFFNNSFALGDSIVYTYDSDNLIISYDQFSKLGPTSNWELQLRVSNITYINRKEASLTLDVDGLGTGTISPFYRFIDLEWDAGYYPIVDDLISYVRESYSPRMFGETSLGGAPSNAKVQINLFGWSDIQKIGLISQSVTNFELYQAIGSGGPGTPLSDTTFLSIQLDANDNIILIEAEKPSSSGFGRDPLTWDSLALDIEGNQILKISLLYDLNSQQYNLNNQEERIIAYSGNSIEQIDLTRDDGLFAEYFRFDLFNGLRISNQLFDQQDIQPLKVFPNPATKFIDVAYLNMHSNESYSIFYIDGKLVQTGRIHDGRIFTENLPSGVYILQVPNGKRAKFIIE